MTFVNDTIKLLIFLSKLTKKCNFKPSYCLFLSYYILKKLEILLKMKLKVHSTTNETFSSLIVKNLKCNEAYADNNLYILCNSKFINETNNWYYLCTNKTQNRYKVVVILTKDIKQEILYVSESMKFNLKNQLKVNNIDKNDVDYFLVSAPNSSMTYASEAKISLINNPYDFTNDFLNTLLKNYFSTPKYLRPNDIFQVDVKKFIPDTKYCTADSKLDVLYFKVNDIKSENVQTNVDGNFIVYGQTTLIQEANANSYIPHKHISKILPVTLYELLQQLQYCIAPFLQQDTYINVKPVFLVEGPNGSGKYRLSKTAAQTLGLHFLEADFSEVQSLTSAQTEGKLRIILQDAEKCTPCILILRNIQIFGINSEGQVDNRVLAAFTTEIKTLYLKKRKYPIIIIATSTESEIPIDTERTFVEKITVNHLNQEQKSEILKWFVKSKRLKCKADLPKIASMCSDFALADLEALVMHAIKNHFRKIDSSQNAKSTELTYDDFLSAIEYMQSIFSDQIGAPRVPRVHWEDIGGLADLKREIMRRIEMPLLNISGLGKSGLLLYGPPGTGKTLLAKAVATECQLAFLSVKGPELLNMYVGQSEKNVRQVFERARAAAPCIIFFDELDSLAPNRGQSGDSGGVMDRVVSQLLAEMDGLDSAGRVFIIGATNRPDLIDPALLRPGRFDKMLYVGVYAEPEAQLGVLRALTRHFNLEESGDELEALIGKLPENLTGADLYSVCSNAWLRAVRRLMNDQDVEKEKLKGEDVVVCLEDFSCASNDLVPSVSKEELLRYERLRAELSGGK